MKIIVALCSSSLLFSTAHAKSASAEDVFRKYKVKVNKVEVVEGRKLYYVELPFDPSIGKNSNRLEAAVAVANGCKPFEMVSGQDKVKIIVDAKAGKQGCSISENIQPLP